MIHRMKKTELKNNDDIWNAMVSIMSEYEFPTENKTANRAYMIYNYYSELESGGHEALFNWFSWYIEEIGSEQYFNELVRLLREIHALDYALLEEKYGLKLWQLYQALENDEIPEDEFYSLIEKADSEYHQLNGRLGDLLESYFVHIHTELIQIVD